MVTFGGIVLYERSNAMLALNCNFQTTIQERTGYKQLNCPPPSSAITTAVAATTAPVKATIQPHTFFCSWLGPDLLPPTGRLQTQNFASRGSYIALRPARALLYCIVHCKTLTRLRAQAWGKANNSRPPITAAPSGLPRSRHELHRSLQKH